METKRKRKPSLEERGVFEQRLLEKRGVFEQRLLEERLAGRHAYNDATLITNNAVLEFSSGSDFYAYASSLGFLGLLWIAWG